MRILLDEDVPRRLGALLTGHEVETVPRNGWSDVKNGKLLALAATKFDVFLTMDQNIEFQQNLANLPIAILVVEAHSNRMEHLQPLVADILDGLVHIPLRSLRRVGRRHPDSGMT
jgi:predicted nuclease of predicted toxin-antitoxin system